MDRELTVNADWVRDQLKGDTPLCLVEVRHAGDLDLAVMKARGALRMDSGELTSRLEEIPKDRTVVVYTTAPCDTPAERLVDLLAGAGSVRPRLLRGGFKAYLSAGLPVEEIGEGRNMTRLRGY
ncbi:hypothetical protein GMSM_19890 [Geomonas sp. Red276]